MAHSKINVREPELYVQNGVAANFPGRPFIGIGVRLCRCEVRGLFSLGIISIFLSDGDEICTTFQIIKVNEARSVVVIKMKDGNEY